MPTLPYTVGARLIGRKREDEPAYKPGLLTTIGRALDWPGRQLRKLITGEDDPSGRDVLEKLGILGPNKQGFDVGDVSGFLAEVLLDPLTYLGGIGTWTKAGKLASRATALERALKAAQASKNVKAVHEAARGLTAARKAQMATGAPLRLGKTWRAQGAMRQRSLLKARLPFTGVEKTIVTAAPVLGALEKVAPAVQRYVPGASLVNRLFNPRFGRLETTRPVYDLSDMAKRAAEQRVLQQGAQFSEQLTPLMKASALPREDFLAKTVRGAEFLGQPEKYYKGSYDVLDRAHAATRRMHEAALKAGASPEELAKLEKRASRVLGKARKQSKRLMEFKATGEKAIGEMPEGTRPVMEEMQRIFGEGIQKEMAEGIRVSPLRSLLNYMPRIAGKGQQEFRRLTPTAQSKVAMNRVYGIRAGHHKRRLAHLRDVPTPDANNILKKVYGTKGDWFDPDPRHTFARHALSQATTVENAKLAKSLVASEGMQHIPGQTVDAAEFLKSAGIQVADKKALKGIGIPEDVAQEYLKVTRRLESPEEIKELGRLFDKVSSAFRFGLTTPFPAFHVRNILSDTALSFVGGAWRNPAEALRTMKDAWRLARDPEWLKKAEVLGILRTGKSREIMEEITKDPSGLIARTLEEHPKLRAAVGGAKRNYAELGENFTRTWHFLGKKAQGLSDLEAAGEVRKWLLDYSALSDFERRVMRRALLFYQWPRKVTPLLVKSYMESPSRMALLTRGSTMPTMRRDDQPLPEWVRQSAAIPLSPTPQGDPRFLFGMGSPLEEFTKFDPSAPEGVGMGSIRSIMRRLAVQLNPLIRAPAEYASGKEFFFDRDIMLGDRAPALLNLPGLKQVFGTQKEELPGGKVRYHGDPLKMHALYRSMPWSRAVQTGSDIANVFSGFDPKESRGQSLLQSIFGFKVQDIDPIDQQRSLIEAQEHKFRQWQREGKVGTKPIFYARMLEGAKDPEVVQALREQRGLQKALKLMMERQRNAPP